MPKYEDPFAFEQSEKIKDPFASDLFPKEKPPPPPKPPAPVTYGQVGSAVGNVVSQVPQTLYEMGAGTVNAFGQSLGMAQAPFDVAAGLIQGQGLQKSMERGGERIDAYKHWNPMPPTLSKEGSWFSQILGGGVNALVQSGIISEGSAEAVGRALAVAGAPTMLNSLRAPLVAGVENARARWQQRVPPPVVRAGQLLAETEQTLPSGLAQGARETTNVAAERAALAEAQQRLGVQRLPESADPNIRRQQLATNRMGQNVEVKASEFGLAAQSAEQAATGLRSGLQVGEVNPGVLDFVGKKLEASSKNSALAQIEGEASTALAKVAEVIPATERPAPLPMGQAILKWIRGEGPSGEKVATGVRAVQKVFNKEYERFNGEKGAIVSSADMQKALNTSASSATESGRVLRGFWDESKKIERRLGGGDTPETPTFAEAAALKAVGKEPGDTILPPNLTLAQARGLKGELYTAANMAKAADNPAASELYRLAGIAREAETAAAKRLGPEKFRQYDAIRSSYENVLVEGFRRGHGLDLTSFGKEAGVKGGAKIAPANVLDTLVNGKAAAQNAHDFVFAAGAEEAARTGKLLTGLKEADILALGQENARTIVRPYIESQIAEIFNKGGVKNVTKYLDAHRDAFSAYGLDFNELRTAATTYNESMVRLSGAKVAVARDTVAGVVNQADPTKLGKYVFDSANPKAAYSNLQAVSKDPLWRSGIKTLLVDELKTRIDGGTDIFANAKTRGAMEAIYTKPELQALQDYHTIMKRLNDSPARGAGKELSPHAAKLVEKAAELPAVGFGPWYVAKRAVLLALKLKTSAADAAALSWVDDAFINPAKARDIKLALRGHEAAAKRIRAGISAEESAMKRLAVKTVKGGAKQIPAALPGAAGGAILNRGDKVLPDFSAMDDAMLLAHP